ncbi:hypothetical protein GQ53DRAFT_807099 [Thozetella sp. PMI_491]|nr:hypothetical protein GQ53DRAFT_807099 [Thozetella sp. PMI_491]
MRFTQFILPVALSASTAFSAKIKARDTTDFKLYAYGEGIGGLPVFYLQGAAYIGDVNNLTSDISGEAVQVTFTDNDGVWTISPDNSSAPFSNETFYVPGPSSGGGPGGFLNGTAPPDNSTFTSSGWSFYGSIAILELSDGSWATNFYAALVTFPSR